ncbi:hypothetical protein [Hydrogenophaga sp. BPS33]|uniref:hypothetical protein n=1 Tax=Hydrogenophaga sp. BPS33 TaxID=2651974 RepID=UPI00131FBD86|nr:hypothetical protein [Hydrogenophaga sp. BPS33]QHE89171.1 hypothetical protein F9K07_29715 [Hydrogenophaga sp. BPS33]
MRAFLVILMLTLLPLQFSAAAEAECCGHVAVAQGSQVQHRQPAHMLAGSGSEELATNGLGFDLDCGTCHTNCAAALTATSATTAVPVGIERVEHLVELILPPWHKRPYRPKWSAPRGSGLNALA